jgi:hypothetical protein
MGLGEVQQQVRTIATCYCHVSKPTISFERDLEKQLNGSTEFITNNIQSLTDALAKLRSELAALRDTVEAPKPEPKGVEIDLSDLNPRPGFVPSWRDPPNLPPSFKFNDIMQTVD